MMQSGVDFINILFEAFMHADPESTKRQSSQQSFLSSWDLRTYKLLVEH